MLHFCNYKHKPDLTGIITFGISDSFHIFNAKFQASYYAE